MDKFTPEVAEKLGNYVYRLVDPRDGLTFYVGKGRGDRVFAHARDELAMSDDDELANQKTETIREIRNAGLKVIHVIHRHAIPDAAIDEVEAAVIDAYAGLANIQGGYGSSIRGPMHVDEVEVLYDLPEVEFDPPERLMLIKIPKIEDRSSRQAILEQAQWAWRVNRSKANQAEYILAVLEGVVIGVFELIEWLPATAANFPQHPRRQHNGTGRSACRCREVSPEIWDRFVGTRGKRITNDAMIRGQAPVRYWNIP